VRKKLYSINIELGIYPFQLKAQDFKDLNKCKKVKTCNLLLTYALIKTYAATVAKHRPYSEKTEGEWNAQNYC